MRSIYTLMGLPFITFVLILDVFILKTRVVYKKDFWIVLGVMMLFTAVFDQLLTGLPIVNYNEANIIGIRLFFAPIEDFSYTIAGVILIGSILQYGKR